MPEIEHWVFGGRLPATLRVLFAGGGTGDGCIMLAQQLADRGIAAEIVHLDLSAPAQAIAAQRAEQRGLAAIRFVNGSLLEAESAALGRFDYVDCCGVLHHLEDPAAGLARLAALLAPRGGMGLMVYAPSGRSGVYETQAALRLVAPPAETMPARLDIARRLVSSLPASNLLRRNPVVRDHLDGGEAGLYDLLLHARDRAFAVEDFLALIDGAGLRLATLVEPARYDPGTYLQDPVLRRRAAALSPRERAMLAESLAGNIGRHVAYVTAPDAEAPPDPADLSLVPVWWLTDAAQIAAGLGPQRVLSVTLDGLALKWPLPPQAPALIKAIDGRRTLGQIREAVGPALFDKAWPACWAVLNGINRLFLKRP